LRYGTRPSPDSRTAQGGIGWRARDANNYYVVRANAFEDIVVLYKIVKGVRSSLDVVGRKGGYGVGVLVPANVWPSLRIGFKATRFKASFNGKELLEVDHPTFTDPGKIGLWTKADSVTLFDQMTHGVIK
jgi:hypothetical protein